MPSHIPSFSVIQMSPLSCEILFHNLMANTKSNEIDTEFVPSIW